MRAPKPTDGELAILAVLWRRGASTVRQVFEVLNEEREVGYTTVLKLLQIMTEKGLVERDDSERTHVFAARHSQESTQQGLVQDLLDRAFEGSSMKLVMQALATQKSSPEDLAEIRRMLNEAETGGNP
jgi:predicted transcriptional regulator